MLLSDWVDDLMQISVYSPKHHLSLFMIKNLGRKVKTNLDSILKSIFLNKEQPTLVLLPGKSHGWRSLVGCSPWGC